ncbi:hypothetical protein, partial [Paenibacillus polymyxa]|uniref:hypothetical protein n=1 Tax=Paenibacillus polymyxa TaxID=1406 RepID=UPI0019553718
YLVTREEEQDHFTELPKFKSKHETSMQHRNSEITEQKLLFPHFFVIIMTRRGIEPRNKIFRTGSGTMFPPVSSFPSACTSRNKKAGTLTDLIAEVLAPRFVPYLIFHDTNLPHKKSSGAP